MDAVWTWHDTGCLFPVAATTETGGEMCQVDVMALIRRGGAPVEGEILF